MSLSFTIQLQRYNGDILISLVAVIDMLLMAIFSLRTKTWAAILIWFILAPVAHRLDIGPLFVSPIVPFYLQIPPLVTVL